MRIDQYESQFKSAIKERYRYQKVSLEKVVLICDFSAPNAQKLAALSTRLLPAQAKPEMHVLSDTMFKSVQDAVAQIEALQPELIIAQRNIKTSDENLLYGLSDYVDALTQVSTAPVLLLPNLSLEQLETSLRDCSDIMVQTDHLTGDERLINWAVCFAQKNGSLILTHIEDQHVFEYYIAAISRIPEIETELAANKLREDLLRVPGDYIQTAKESLAEILPELRVDGIVQLGDSLDAHQELLNRHQVDILVLNTKDHGQLAMAGKSYALTVELKSTPLLLL